MQLRLMRRRPHDDGKYLFEVVSPGPHVSGVSAVANALARLALGQPFALEIVGTSQARWFTVRAGSADLLDHLQRELGVLYPQARVRQIDTTNEPLSDHALPREGEQVAACRLELREPNHLPLRTFEDHDLGGDQHPQADPVLGILGAAGRVPPGWRAVAQLLLTRAPDDWGCRHEPLLEDKHSSPAANSERSLTSVFMWAGLLPVLGALYQGYQWYLDQDWLRVGGLIAAALIVMAGALGVAHRLSGRRRFVSPELVRQKITPLAYSAEVRLAIFAPADVPRSSAERYLDQLAAAYRQYNLSFGNGLIAKRLRDLDLALLRVAGKAAILNVLELAGMWHVPHVAAEAPFVEKTGFRRLAPLPDLVASGCRIGAFDHQGHQVPVCLPDEVLQRHLLLIAKTRQGKSSLLLRFAQHLMEQDRAVLLVDPHSDLAQDALGVIPRERRSNVVYLDLADGHYPFGLNLLDSGLNWSRDQATDNIVSILRRQWDQYWGPRMEMALRYGVRALFEANQAICAADRHARNRQYTILDLIPFLVDPMFRRQVLNDVADPPVKWYWQDTFERLDRKTQIDSVNPVVTKIGRYSASLAARSIVGQPRSTIDPAAWLRSGAIVIVNTAKWRVGDGTSALIGATLLNLMSTIVAEQVGVASGQRRPISIIVDEFHALPGADYETILAELPKYGANLILATQGLGRLETLDLAHQRSLKRDVFSNLGGLICFNTSAQDASQLVPELGEKVTVEDLVALPPFHCYVRFGTSDPVVCDGQPVFSVALDRPPCPDVTMQHSLAAASAALYGRDAIAVENDIRSALARVEQSRHVWRVELQDQGVAHDVQEDAAGQQKKRKKQRTRKRTSEPDQATLFGPALPSGNGREPVKAPGPNDEDTVDDEGEDDDQ